uniref:FAD-binding FR-type domain-containing protein n=1 Tax=Davidia involucrata TaxID=16924 RepID=A0A5B7CHZ1_DAVIN
MHLINIQVLVLLGDVFSLVMSKPNRFKYKSGQYRFLQCPSISPFEWHPFSIFSTPGDNYLSVHIQIVGNGSTCVIGRITFGQPGNVDKEGFVHIGGERFAAFIVKLQMFNSGRADQRIDNPWHSKPATRFTKSRHIAHRPDRQRA